MGCGLGVVQHLPLAAAAGTEMIAAGFDAVRRRGDNSHTARLRITFFLFHDQGVNHIPRHHARNEDGEPLMFGHGFPLSTRVQYL